MVFNYTLSKKEFFDFHKKYISDSIKCNKYFIKNMIGLLIIYCIMYILVWKELKISIIIGFTGSSIIFQYLGGNFF